MQKWEYKTVSIEYDHNDYEELLVTGVNHKKLSPNDRLDAYLTKLGQDEWELVGQSTTRTDQLLYTFKRPSRQID
jgi:hypothetical protein